MPPLLPQEPSAARQVPDDTWETSALAAAEAKNSQRVPVLLPRLGMMKKSRNLLLEPAEKLGGLQTWKRRVKKPECLQCLPFEAGSFQQDPLRDDSTGLKAIGFIDVQILRETH